MSTIQSEITRIKNATNTLKNYTMNAPYGKNLALIDNTIISPTNINQCASKITSLCSCENLGVVQISQSIHDYRYMFDEYADGKLKFFIAEERD